MKVKIGGEVVNNLKYTDDTPLDAETEKYLRTLIEDDTGTGKKAALHLNLKKTKVMLIAGMSTFAANKAPIEIKNKIK